MTDPRFLADYDVRAMSDWLLHGAATGDYEPYEIVPEPSVASQIERLYVLQEQGVRHRFKRALVTAVAEWTAQMPVVALRTLAYIGAYVRVVDVVPLFAHLIRSRLLERLRMCERDEQDDVIETIGVLLAVISGFAPHPQAAAAAEAFYYDDRLPSRFCAISLNALCRTDPERYPEYVPRIIRLMQREPLAFHTPLVLDRLIETITPPLFAKYFPSLEAEIKSALISLLNEAPKVRARIEADEKTYSLITSYGGEERLYLCPAAEQPPTVDDFKSVYDGLFQSYGGVDQLDLLLRTGGFAPPPSRTYHAEFQ